MKKLIVLWGIICCVCSLVAAQQKYALVIGNSAYTSVTPLRNPVNDANDMEATLKSLGWTVEKVLNGSLDSMENAVTRLKNRLGVSKDAYGFFFYAGHGVQSRGENYLIPVEAAVSSENYLRQRAMSVQTMLDELNDAGNALNVVVLDACRDNPFGWGRNSTRGLQVVGQQPADSIIVYATSAGSTAADGEGRNGLFTAQLLNNLKAPGLEVREVFRRTHADVRKASKDAQRPAVYDQFGGLAYLGTKPSAPAPVAVQPTPAPAPAPAPKPAAVQPAPAPAPAPKPAAVQPAPVPAPTPKPTPASVPRDMVRIQGGTFTMGSPASEVGRSDNEGPQHQVTVSAFYMGKYEVTQKEWQEVMGNNPSYFKGDTLPVESVSWYDVIEYCNKRSVKEGLTPAYTIDKSRRDPNNQSNYDDVKWIVTWNRQANGYRLPTEAEWEYVCRAGTTTPYYTGSSVDSAGWYDSNSGSTTHPVGQKQGNAWGLYDMHGNVWEWCWDWYGSYSAGSQSDPMGAVSGAFRVVRGGSWDDHGQSLRSAYRFIGNATDGNYDLGCRLVRP